MLRLFAVPALLTAAWSPSVLVAQDAVVAPLFGVHTGGHAVMGGALGVPLGDAGGPLALIISAGVDATNDWLEPERWEYWEANVDLAVYGGAPGQGGLFLLGGLNLAGVYEEVSVGFPSGRRSEETTLAANLGGGFAFVVRSVMPVLGAKVELGKRRPFLIFLALGIPLGGD